jgi:transposase, IS5 family
MGQLGFFDLNRRYESLTEKNDPLVAIAAMVPFESFRPKLIAALIKGELRRSEAERKSSAGRKPWDEVVIFKALVLQALYNLSDDQAEYQLRDRFSFMRFLGLELEDAVPEAKTLWLYREALAKAGAVEELFDLFDGFLKDKGYLARGGQIIDASIVSAPKQHNSVTRTFGSREDNETIKDGKMPEDWKSKPAKDRQKDKDARWTKKHERSYFGYKNHIGVDRRQFVRRYAVSDASVHDSQKFEDVLDTSNTASGVWAKRAKGSVKRSLMEWRAEGDSAYRSTEIEEKLAERGLKSRIHRRAYRNRELSEAQKAANTTRSKVCARVEHVFGDQKNGMGAGIVRTIGIVRARCKIGMTNLVYNMRRFVCLERMATASG